MRRDLGEPPLPAGAVGPDSPGAAGPDTSEGAERSLRGSSRGRPRPLATRSLCFIVSKTGTSPFAASRGPAT